jgi:hypothetical protein
LKVFAVLDRRADLVGVLDAATATVVELARRTTLWLSADAQGSVIRPIALICALKRR